MLARTDGQTTFVTCTKRGAAAINDLAVQVLFRNRNRRPVDSLPADYKDNAENYDERGQLRVVLTRNRDKQNHYVNGMVAEVEALDAASGCLRVMTQTGRRLAVYPYTDAEVPRAGWSTTPCARATRGPSTSIRGQS